METKILYQSNRSNSKTVGCIDAFVKHNALGAKILFATGYESSKYQGRLQMSNGCDNLYVGNPLDMKYVGHNFTLILMK